MALLTSGTWLVTKPNPSYVRLRQLPSCQGAMARLIMITMPLALIYMLVLFESRKCPLVSSPRELGVPSNLEMRHTTQDVIHTGERQVSDESLTKGSSHNNLPGSSVFRAPTDTSEKLTADLPACVADGGAAKSFLVIFMGHSGSSAIISELRGHSRVLIEASEPIDHDEYEFNTSLALQHTRAFFLRGTRAGKIPGFKMRPWHIGQRPEAWVALAKEFDTRIIWQYRRHILKQAVGEYSKKYFNDKSSVEGLRSAEEVKNRCKTGSGCRFNISDFDFFHRTLKDCLHSDLAIAKAVNLILNGSKCVHDLPYEDYLYHREETIRRLQRFLGVEYEHTVPKRFKATSDNLCDVIENWDKVCEHFYGCHVWRHMFEDTRNGCFCEFSSGPTLYCDTVFKN